MKRKWALWALILVVATGVAATNRQSAPTIGLVNLEMIMQQTPGYAEALQAFEEEFQPFEDEIQAMIQRRDSMMQEYERQQVVLSPTSRQEKETEIRDLQQRFEQRAQELQSRSQARERELVAPLEQRVQAIIEGIRAERNLGIVFDLASIQGVAAFDRALDLTPLVVQRLQQSQ